MVVFNYSGAEINAKVVYYGPALSGKTTNLEYLYAKMPAQTKGKMVSMKTRTDRTLFFDFLPVEVGEINGFRTRIMLYTVPGQVYYNATRKLVLKGVDAVVFVADSSKSKMEENLESLRNLEENLNEHDLTLDTIPWIIQYNKRDVKDALPVETLAKKLNLLNVPSFEAVATKGKGVHETFEGISKLLYSQLAQRLQEVPPAENAPAKKTKPKKKASVPASPVEAAADDPPITDVVEAALREVGDQEPAPAPARAQKATREPDDDFKFAPLERDVIDDTVGRVVEFEETSPETAPPSAGEFIVDPFNSRREAKPAEDPPAESPQPEKRQPERRQPEKRQPEKRQPEKPQPEPADLRTTPRVAPKRPAAAPPPPPRERPATPELSIKVPVVITRSQVRKTLPIKLLLEIQVVDDE